MRNPAAALLSVRNDKGSAVSLSGGSGKDVLSILGNGASNAISSAGSHEFIQRKGENGMLRERYGLDASQEQVVYQTDGGMGVI